MKPSIRFFKKSNKVKTECLRELPENVTSSFQCVRCNEAMELLKEFNWYKCPKCGKFIKR